MDRKWYPSNQRSVAVLVSAIAERKFCFDPLYWKIRIIENEATTDCCKASELRLCKFEKSLEI